MGYDLSFETFIAASFIDFLRSRQSERNRLWILEVDGQVNGSIGIVGRANQQAQLRWFLVHPQYQGIGLGRRLIQDALDFCRDVGYQSVFLWTTTEQTPAIRLYQSLNFQIVEEQKESRWGKNLITQRYVLDLTSG